MVEDVPGAGRESRSPRQGFMRLGRGSSRSREVLRIHAVVYKRGEDVSNGDSAISSTFTWEVTAVSNLSGHQCGFDHSCAGPGHFGTVAQLG